MRTALCSVATEISTAVSYSAEASALRDSLADILSDNQPLPWNYLPLILEKFFHISRKRPAQPGLTTTITLFVLLALCCTLFFCFFQEYKEIVVLC